MWYVSCNHLHITAWISITTRKFCVCVFAFAEMHNPARWCVTPQPRFKVCHLFVCLRNCMVWSAGWLPWCGNMSGEDGMQLSPTVPEWCSTFAGVIWCQCRLVWLVVVWSRVPTEHHAAVRRLLAQVTPANYRPAGDIYSHAGHTDVDCYRGWIYLS